MKKISENIVDFRNQLRNGFLNYAPNTNLNELEELIKEFTVHKFLKKELIINVGEMSDTFYFVCKGLIRIYYVKEDKEITNYFIKENMVFAGSSNISGINNISNYEAFAETYTLKIKFKILESFFTKYHSLEHIARKMVEYNYGIFMKKTHDVLFLSAEERYHIFQKDHSDLLNRLPLKIVASYLGITQETLSRLRSKN